MSVDIDRLSRVDGVFALVLVVCATRLVSGAQDCWWTGCQPNSWAVTGCGQYNRTEKTRETCDDGFKYQCCAKEEPAEELPADQCWWTGCQPNTWAVTGCDQYNRTEKTRETCDDESSNHGFKYQCCEKKEPAEEFLADQCWWSECQPEDWADRGCPSNTVQNRSQACTEGGDLYQCCLKKSAALLEEMRQAEQDEVEDVSGESFADYVKHLLLKGNNYTVLPDRLRCDMVDVDRLHVFRVRDEGIRTCDLCPNFPQHRYRNMHLDREPAEVRENFEFPDCFGLCFQTDRCTAFGYDHELRKCHLHDSTDGPMEEADRWTTVFMTQPTGVLFDWAYSRHTRTTGASPLSRRPADTFLSCVDACNALPSCAAVSYSLTDSECTAYGDADSAVDRVDYVYGHLSAYRMGALPAAGGRGDAWRFADTGDGDVLSLKPAAAAAATGADDARCSEAAGGEGGGARGAFYSKACLTAPTAGCDAQTGCKACYYPEKSAGSPAPEGGLVVCPDSDMAYLDDMARVLDAEMAGCLADADCMGVGVDPGRAEPITLADFGRRAYRKTFALRYPRQTAVGVHRLLPRYEFAENLAVRPLSGNGSGAVNTADGVTLDECESRYRGSAGLRRMTYYRAESRCVLSSESVRLTETRDAITLFKKPAFRSAQLNYVRTAGVRVEARASRSRMRTDCRADCEETCAGTCNRPGNEWCAFVSVEYRADTSRCYFFTANDTGLRLEPADDSVVLVAQGRTNFTLAALDRVNPFDGHENIVLDCFSGTVGQTQTSLTVYGDPERTTAVAVRRRRGFFSWIAKAAKTVGETVVNAVKSTVTEVVDTAKGVVKAVDKAVHGDFEGAKKAALDIPIVKDVKNVVEFGGAVVSGDWDSAKEKAADAGASLLNVGLTFVPGVGKVVGNIGKSAAKGIKPALKNGNAATKNIKPKKNDSKNPDKKKDKDKQKEDEETCEYRTKRAAAKGKTTKKKCDPNKCDAPKGVKNSFGDSFQPCDDKKVGADCSYECKVGFEEKGPSVKCSNVPKKKATWNPKPECTLYMCDAGPYPVVPVMTPKVEGLSSIASSKYIVAYAVLFDKSRRLPVWSAAFHQSDQLASKSYNDFKNTNRNENFYKYPCAALKKNQASDSDYVNSGYDRGHLTPANIARWSRKSIKSTFAFINIAPQEPEINEQPWKDVEFHVECFTSKNRALVVTGICKDSLKKKIGRQNIEVPKCFWKMLCYLDEKLDEQVVGFVADNSPIQAGTMDARKDAIFTPVSQADILRLYDNSLANPWLKLSKLSISRQHDVQSSSQPGAIFMPINPYSCMEAMTLSDDEKDAWEDKLKKTSKTKADGSSGSSKKKKTRKRRDVKAKLKRGCTASELKEKREFFELYSRQKAAYLDDSDSGDDIGSSDEDQPSGDVDVAVQKCGKRIVGYYTSWGKKKINSKILAKLTHVIYAFLEMREDGTVDLGSPDKAHSLDVGKETQVSRERLKHLMELSKFYPHVKIMFAVGGWENSQYFSKIAASSESRVRFIASIVKLIEKYGFDGVDIDWEYPVTGGAIEGTQHDKSNYVLLMKELRQALDVFAEEAGRKNAFLISFAGAAGQWTLDPGFDLPGLLKYADFVNVMTYDYFGAWGSKWGAYTGSPAPLFFGMPPRFSGKTNVDWTIKYYTCKTKLPHKINMGVPFYGRFWKNVGDSVDGKDQMWRTAQPVNGVYEGGSTPWFKIQEDHLSDSRFQQSFHEKSKTPYAWNAATKEFLGYENQKSLDFKVKYATDKNVGGLMIWSVDLDDEELTLLNSVYKAPLCDKTDPKDVNHKCSPIDEKRWWTSEDGDDVAGLCGRSAPLYKGYYSVCDPDDPGYSCCGPSGYCGSGDKYCNCPTCKDYGKNPSLILNAPIRPTVPVTWYFLNAKEGLRGRCGRKIPKIDDVYPTCNPDDDNAYCCSNGNYCGKNAEFCDCQGCVNFKKTPTYRYGPKKWWTQEDGEKRAGTCGPKADKVDGIYQAECEPNTKFSCCSSNGYCGSGPDFCDCKGCKRF